MNIELFNFEYPEELIAQHPLHQRDASRLMVINPLHARHEHRFFKDVVDYFGHDDLVIFNDVKVQPSRLFGRNHQGRQIEVLLLDAQEADKWSCLVRPASKIASGEVLSFEGVGALREAPLLSGVITGAGDQWTISLSTVGAYCNTPLQSAIEQVGVPPLPPYIKRENPFVDKEVDRYCYQTVYAMNDGAAAAPTAGFHFTEELLLSLKERGAELAFCTLHVGRDTFQAVRSEQIEDHRMHGEKYFINPETALLINQAKEEGRRVTAVGTTTLRALESAWSRDDGVRPGSAYTKAFIYPGYSFKVVDRLITNFHQPKSTLLMLVSAFMGRGFMFDCYQEAIANRYRLFSFGDAMLILNRATTS